jgi:hypothetical protein
MTHNVGIRYAWRGILILFVYPDFSNPGKLNIDSLILMNKALRVLSTLQESIRLWVHINQGYNYYMISQSNLQSTLLPVVNQI